MNAPSAVAKPTLCAVVSLGGNMYALDPVPSPGSNPGFVLPASAKSNAARTEVVPTPTPEFPLT